MRTHFPLLLVLAAVISVSVAAAACGGGSDEPSPTSTVAAPEPTAEPEPEPTATEDSSMEAPEPTPEPAGDDQPVTARVDPKPQMPEQPALLAPLTGNELKAPEFVDPGRWINSEPFTMEEQRGNVVLIDFWTYTCINCVRTLPYVRSWHDKYADSGLVTVGVHTPEFDFEKLYDNVVEAVKKFDLRYPIVQDNDFGTWVAFKNRYWPAKYLIDKDGNVRYEHFGEGAYHETELVIRELLEETGADLSGISSETAPQPEFDSGARSDDPMKRETRELYAGYERNYGALSSGGAVPPYILNPEYYTEIDTEVSYTDIGEYQNHFLYLNGLWRNEAERIVHARETEDYEDYIALKFYATSVNAVMAPVNPGSFDLRVTLDDRPLTMEEAGFDIMFDEEGNSFARVVEDRMYSLVNKEEFGTHNLKLSSNSDDFALFAFTFGSFVGGEQES